MRAMLARSAVLCLLALASATVFAHKAIDSYLTLAISEDGSLNGHWDIALRDLEDAIGLDADHNGELTWGEVRARHGEIARYALSRLALRSDSASCTLEAGNQQIDEHTDGAYTVNNMGVNVTSNATSTVYVAPGLVVTIDGPTLTPGTTVTYTISYVNTGTAPANGVTISDVLPSTPWVWASTTAALMLGINPKSSA